MENNKLCPLVQDLLPYLADGIASPESKHMMLEHMKTCDICRKMYENMCPVKEEILPEILGTASAMSGCPVFRRDA